MAKYVDNRGNKGNHYHDEGTGQFTSKDAVGTKNVSEGNNTQNIVNEDSMRPGALDGLRKLWQQTQQTVQVQKL